MVNWRDWRKEKDAASPRSSTALSIVFILAIPLAFTIEGFHGRCLGFIHLGHIHCLGLLQGTCCFLGFRTCNFPARHQKKYTDKFE